MIEIDAIRNGNRLALARFLTQVENDTPAGRAALNALFPYTGRAHLIGITGAPGTGKSSLVNQLARYYRKLDMPKRVAVVAVDPSSPFTGGAVLGDRIRMSELSGDPGVFIRSMATRGSLGGLARATAGMVQAFDAAGYEIILIETVGAGQSEVDIARLAHTTLVVEAPGLGDEIQAIKAGILEIADVLVVNKADRPGVENTERALRGMLQLAHPVQRVFPHHGRTERISPSLTPDTSHPDTSLWIPPIQRTVASEGKGISELGQAIARHQEFLVTTGDLQRRERARLQTELELHIQDLLVNQWRAAIINGRYEDALEKLLNREISPDEAALALVSKETKQ